MRFFFNIRKTLFVIHHFYITNMQLYVKSRIGIIKHKACVYCEAIHFTQTYLMVCFTRVHCNIITFIEIKKEIVTVSDQRPMSTFYHQLYFNTGRIHT